MLAASYSDVRQNFKSYCDKISEDFETLIITRTKGNNVVMMSEEEYSNLMENLYVRSNTESYKELLESIKQLEKGQGKKRELIEVE